MAGAWLRESAPVPALADLVECVWVMELPGAPGSGRIPHAVLPDGCIDLVGSAGGRLAVAGPATAAARFALPSGSTSFGIRFRPGMAASLLGLASDELRDLTPGAAEVLGRLGAELEEQVLSCGRADDATDALQRFALGRISADAPGRSPDAQVTAAVRRLALGRDVTTVAADVGLSERQLRRRFDLAVGYGPKQLQRILRLRACLAAGRRTPSTSWARLAADHGYADHAHLVRDCQALAGGPPSEVIAFSH